MDFGWVDTNKPPVEVRQAYMIIAGWLHIVTGKKRG